MKTKPVYFAISPIRLAICSFFTMGIYDLYWAYKNWEALQDPDKKSISPFWRAWVFNIIFIGPLLFRIKNRSKPMCWGIAGYLTFYYLQAFFSTILYTSINTAESYITIELLCIVLLFCAALCLIPIQKAINKIQKPQKGFQKGELAVIFASLALLAMSAFSGYLTIKKLSEEKLFINQPEIRQKLMTSYRHIMGYETVCQEYGYSMTNYPVVFYQAFEPGLKALSIKLLEINATFPQAWDIAGSKTKEQIISNIREELNNIRKGLIISSVADLTHTSYKDVVWQNSLYEILSLRETCTIIDNNAAFLMESDKKLRQTMQEQHNLL